MQQLCGLEVTKIQVSRAANLPEGFTVFKLPAWQRRQLPSTNMLERMHKEIKRRTRVATLFPNDSSILRLERAILMEIGEEWETGKRYLKMDTEEALN